MPTIHISILFTLLCSLSATASAQSLDSRQCELEANSYYQQKMEELAPTPAQLANPPGRGPAAVAMLNLPRSEFRMSWDLGGEHKAYVRRCLEAINVRRQQIARDERNAQQAREREANRVAQ